MQTIRVLVAGSRSFGNYPYLCTHLDPEILKLQSLFNVIMISGGARGTDSLAARYASEMGIPFELYEADWDGQGKAAGYIRNEKMVAVATKAYLFWDYASRGTQHTITLCRRHEVPLTIFDIRASTIAVMTRAR
jgi:hypothetical protein